MRTVRYVHGSRQCHVEAEIVHDMRIAPIHKISPLALAQILRPAPCDISVGEGRAEGLEMRYHVSRKILERLVRIVWDECKERTEIADDDFRDIEGVPAADKTLKGCEKLILIAIVSKG